MSVGQKVKELRKKRGVSQETLADAIGVERPAISNWERGATSPNTDNVQKLSEYFDVPVSYFYGEDAGTENFNAGIAIKKMQAVSDVTLLAVAEVLAKLSNQPTAVVVDQLEGLVKKRLGEQGLDR